MFMWRDRRMRGGQLKAGGGGGGGGSRPVPIILFFLPIILFRISQNILLLFLRIDPIILNYSHKNSGKLNGFNNYCNVSEVSIIVFSLRLPRAIVSDTVNC